MEPLRTYQISPSASRSLVTRRPTSSTVPLARPTSTTSPTPYWSSKIIVMPARKSVITSLAPRPTATPTTETEARRGAIGISSTEMIISSPTVKITALVTDLSTEPMACVRCRERSVATRPEPCSSLPARVSATWAACRTTRVIERATNLRSRKHASAMPMICVPWLISSEVWVCTQLSTCCGVYSSAVDVGFGVGADVDAAAAADTGRDILSLGRPTT